MHGGMIRQTGPTLVDMSPIFAQMALLAYRWVLGRLVFSLPTQFRPFPCQRRCGLLHSLVGHRNNSLRQRKARRIRGPISSLCQFYTTQENKRRVNSKSCSLIVPDCPTTILSLSKLLEFSSATEQCKSDGAKRTKECCNRWT